MSLEARVEKLEEHHKQMDDSIHGLARVCADIKNIALTNQHDITILKSDVAVLKSDVSELKSDVAVLKSDVSELKSDVAVLKSDVSELKSDVTVLKSDVSELKSDVAVLKSDVSGLKSDVAGLTACVKALAEATHAGFKRTDERIDKLETRFDQLELLIRQSLPTN